MTEVQALFEQSNVLFRDALQIFDNPDASAEDLVVAEAKRTEAFKLKDRASKLHEINAALTENSKVAAQWRGNEIVNNGFKSFGEYLVALFDAGNLRSIQMRKAVDPRLMQYAYRVTDRTTEKFEKLYQPNGGQAAGFGSALPEGYKDLSESIGSAGGFLVPEEFIPELYGADAENNEVRRRATIIPMMRREIRIPVIDQTTTTAGQPHFFGGIVPQWTEEGASKSETDPKFRQVNLVAHKLVCYTEISDELYADSVVSFDAFLRGPMGFAGAIAWTEEYAFLRGTGAGMPLGVLNAGATITVNRQADGEFRLEDAAAMLENFLPGAMNRAVWMMTQSAMSELLTMNGPAGNPSYVFTANAQGSPGMTLFGLPIIFTEKLPIQGQTGDVLLADWSRYLVGDRQNVTIDSTNIYKFQNDQTSFRAVHRVDGQPWLSAPLTLSDGTSQVSPFVILGEKAS
jgi:HK97 family phage major capsid protein